MTLGVGRQDAGSEDERNGDHSRSHINHDKGFDQHTSCEEEQIINTSDINGPGP